MPPTKKSPKEMITVQEVAERMGITPDYVRQELRRGTFPVGFAFNPTGAKWVYPISRAAFDNYMAGGLDAERLASLVAEKVLAQLKGA